MEFTKGFTNLLRAREKELTRRREVKQHPRRWDADTSPNHVQAQLPDGSTIRTKIERTIVPKRSRARMSNHHAARSTDNEFRREPTQQKGMLWTPNNDNASSRRPDAKGTGDASNSVRSFEPRYSEADHMEVMIKEPETQPISQEQLVAAVKGIYADLVMVESKCIEVDNAQGSSKDSNPSLNNDQWQALIALHRTLLHEHHDFFLASKQPLRRLASEYSMPSRMWRHGLPSYLGFAQDQVFSSPENLLMSQRASEYDDANDLKEQIGVSLWGHSKASDKTPKQKARQKSFTRPKPMLQPPVVAETMLTSTSGQKSHRISDQQPSPPPHQQNGPLVARGHIGGMEVRALADTGAGYNIVPAVVAKHLGWDPVSSNGHEHEGGEKLRMANGKFMDTIGAFEAVWEFATDPGKIWKITFHVVRDLVHKAVLGNDFLMGSETMTKYRHRLSRLNRTIRTLQGLPMLFVNNIGAVTQRLQGVIMGDAIEALPDSGSEPNLLSLDYVVRRGMRELINTSNIRMIQFADGTVQKTMGSMWLNWAYASSAGDDADDEWSEHFVEFHVLEGCAYDVILGQDVIEDTDAFVTHEKSFVDVTTCSEPSGLNLVTWASEDHHGQALLPGATGSSSRDWLRIGRQHRSLSPPSATDESTQAPSPLLPDRLPGLGQKMRPGPSGFTSAGLRHHRREELERRAEAERNYRRMPRGPQRDAAVAEEEERQRRYDMAQLLPPISDGSSESDGGLVTTSSAVGAKFVDGRADPGRAASTRESLRTKLGRLRDVFPGGSGRHSVQGDVRVAAQRGVVG